MKLKTGRSINLYITKTTSVTLTLLLLFASLLTVVSCGKDNPTQPQEEFRPSYWNDRLALIALYHATNGENWRNNTNWLSNYPLGSWYGISTDINGKVTSIGLLDNNLEGVIPRELLELEELTAIGLAYNKLKGSVPVEWDNIANITVFNLAVNNLSGSIPRELGNMKSLRYLNLGANNLTGSIPRELGNLIHVTYLNLGDNLLAGIIPPELGNIESLEAILLHGNRLAGHIPPVFVELPSLWRFTLGRNPNLSGCIPVGLREKLNQESNAQLNSLRLPECGTN